MYGTPDYNEKFCLAVDASMYCVGGCLFQMYQDIEHPVCYFSRKLNKHQINYSIVEKEAYALLLAVRLFSVYFGSNSVVVFTDHLPLKALANMSNGNQRLLRWSLELNQYALDIKYRAGRQNILPDLLSRKPDV